MRSREKVAASVLGGGRTESGLRTFGALACFVFIVLAAVGVDGPLLYAALGCSFIGVLGSRVIGAVRVRRRLKRRRRRCLH